MAARLGCKVNNLARMWCLGVGGDVDLYDGAIGLPPRLDPP